MLPSGVVFPGAKVFKNDPKIFSSPKLGSFLKFLIILLYLLLMPKVVEDKIMLEPQKL